MEKLPPWARVLLRVTWLSLVQLSGRVSLLASSSKSPLSSKLPEGGAAVAVGVLVRVGVLVSVAVGPMGVLVGVAVGVALGLIGVLVGVAVGVAVLVGVAVGPLVAVGVGVAAPPDGGGITALSSMMSSKFASIALPLVAPKVNLVAWVVKL